MWRRFAVFTRHNRQLICERDFARVLLGDSSLVRTNSHLLVSDMMVMNVDECHRMAEHLALRSFDKSDN